MNEKEADLLGVMRQIDQRRMSLRRASEELGLSTRQIIRIRKRYIREGAQGMLSLKRGSRSPNKILDNVREQSIQLLKENFVGFGLTLAQEKLQERHGIIFSRETIRKNG